MPPELRNFAVDFGLVTASLVVSWAVTILFSGWKFGRLKRRVQFPMDRTLVAAFLQRLHQRAAELGFRPGSVSGQFLQGGAQFGDLGSFTHARINKELMVDVNESSQPATVGLTLQYLDPIAADTGESAYRDAVLDYISGHADTMKVVSNRSFAAVCTLVGGLGTWAALLGLTALRFNPLLEPILVMGGTYVVLGVVALITIAGKPGQLTGSRLAVIGLAAAATAILFAVALPHLV
jgi:hypothetical protein